ncbi:enoyl-CoA hydratase/isomerase family protein [Actinomadura scrupuli]|uniref:enoyl-CoA hydratase/isomerase family protein n=1 Tax=Actinomadura scrupuli TaxID=559629 RepID=UPI003D95D999
MLDLTIHEQVATVRINRPEKRNAMTPEMWRALPGLLDGLAADPDVRVMVLTGAGGTFCAGADITDLGRLGDELTVVAEEALAAFPKPSIAMIEGYCVGGGCQLAAACDLRFAADDARFGITPAKLGIVYPAATTRRLVGLIGPSAAKYLLFSADLIGAAQALRIGFLDEMLPAPALHDRVREFCRTVATRSQLSVRAAKDLVDLSAAGRLGDEQAAHWRREAAAAGDLEEGVRAFVERRPPRFGWTGSGLTQR